MSCCFGIKTRIDKSPSTSGQTPHTVKLRQSVFLNCGSGDTTREICSKNVEKPINEIHDQQSTETDFEKFELNKSEL